MKSEKVVKESNLDKVRKHFLKTGGGTDDRWFNIKAPSSGQETKVQIRVLPGWGKGAIVNGIKFFYWVSGQHFGFTIGGRRRAISCPEVAGRGKCPVCTFVSKLKGSGNSEYESLIKGFGTSVDKQLRYFVNVIDREDPDKIKIFGTNKKFIEAMLDASDDPDIGDITDIQDGRDVVITRKGSGGQTRYKYRVRSKASSIEFNKEELYKLDKEVDEWMSYEEIVRVLKENYPNELRELGLKFVSKNKKKKKRVVEEDDEQYSEDDVEKDKDTEEEEDTEPAEDEELEGDEDEEDAEGIEDEDDEENEDEE